MRAIPDSLLITQLLLHIDSFRTIPPESCHIQRRIEGASHHVVFIQVGPASRSRTYVIKIPVHGTFERWTPEHADIMRCEALLMQYMAKHTHIPVPKMISFEENVECELGAPYILMRKSPGRAAFHVWFDEGDYEGQNADCPTAQTMKKRETFPKSLARHMAKLQDLQFDKIGTLDIEDFDEPPVITHSWYREDGAWKKRAAVTSTQAFFFAGLEEAWPANPTIEDLLDKDDHSPEAIKEAEQDMYRYRGMRKVFDMIITSPPFTSKAHTTDERGSFVIRHPDLDLQNILVDEEGNVTAILDWHEAVTAPRCVGYAALPQFLTHEWLPGFSISDPPYMSWSVDHYRRIYADAMKEACADGCYTYKSSIYLAAYAAVTKGGSALDVVNKVLMQLPGLRLTDLDEFQERLGRRWEAAEEFLKKEIPKVLAVEEI